MTLFSPQADKLACICGFLGITADWLLTGQESSKNLTQNEREILTLLNEFDERNQVKLIGKMELIAEEMQKKLAKEQLDKLAPVK